jgi:hypothetical protein
LPYNYEIELFNVSIKETGKVYNFDLYVICSGKVRKEIENLLKVTKNFSKFLLILDDVDLYPHCKKGRYENVQNILNATEMRFISNHNSRIYCIEREINGRRCVIMTLLNDKKDRGINKEIREVLKARSKATYKIKQS